jgi:hypothetical protein
VNVYNAGKRAWKRVASGALFSGEGARNAYPSPVVLGPDGYFHVAWVWRDSPAAETNHTLSYAKTKDFSSFFKADGTPLELPLTLTNGDVVDPVPAKQGLLNGSVKVGFDQSGRVIVSYHKFDAAGKTQLFNARAEESGWKIYTTSTWDYRWDFSGRGTIPLDINVYPVEVSGADLVQRYRHKVAGTGVWKLNEDHLSVTENRKLPSYLESTMKPEQEGRVVQLMPDALAPQIYLRWETYPANRDRAREPAFAAPAHSELSLMIRQ